ncbi:hypothetical protein [Metabacillus malikii]|uniref:Uncharacterized protein n=1 Tax=Metabacillus malikii TaxID=1504265 RepID=A0ABT9ZMB9_9BACI|nr:hypothetical protein [Metabacillus malikii]MDQ0233423.1 hypothetical protein [Metabacillus malikii]
MMLRLGMYLSHLIEKVMDSKKEVADVILEAMMFAPKKTKFH